MSVNDSLRRRLHAATLVAADAAAYALVTAIVATVGAVVLGVGTGGGLVRAKAVLFLVGVVLMAYATVLLWPSRREAFRERDADGRPRVGESVPESESRTHYQAFVEAVPPSRWLRSPPPERRLTPGGKLFLASVTVLAVSYAMEAVFGIA